MYFFYIYGHDSPVSRIKMKTRNWRCDVPIRVEEYGAKSLFHALISLPNQSAMHRLTRESRLRKGLRQSVPFYRAREGMGLIRYRRISRRGC